MRWLRRSAPRQNTAHPPALFPEDVLSNVTAAECGRLAELAAGRRVLEIGSYLGRSTIAMAATAQVVHSIDPHNGGPAEDPNTLPGFLTNLTRYGVRDRVIVHVGVSAQIAALFRPSSFEVVFIDAAHHRPYVDADLRLSIGCLAPGGTIAFHDYATEGAYAVDGTWEPFSVDQAVREFADRAGIAVEQVDSMAVIVAPWADAEPEATGAWAGAIVALDEYLAR